MAVPAPLPPLPLVGEGEGQAPHLSPAQSGTQVAAVALAAAAFEGLERVAVAAD